MKKYQIYQVTNRINGKIYIGKHQCSCKECKYFGSGKLLKRAIKKYGIDNFTKTILFECDNEQEMVSKEKELVTEEFCFLDTNYNLCEGGKGGFGYINLNRLNNTDKTRKASSFHSKIRMKKIRKNREEIWFNFPIEKEKFYKLISIGIKKKIKKDGHWWIGRKHSEKTKKKMSLSQKNKHNGSKNSQYGTMWITNGVENKKIKKQDILPDGYKKGRIIK